MGNTFQAGGQTWIVGVNVSSVSRVKAATGIHLGKALDDNFRVLNELLSDVIQLVDVVYLICKPQADALGMTAEKFGETIGNGDTVEAMGEAFVAGLIDFFPKRQREILTRLTEKGRAVANLLAEKMTKELDSLETSTLCESLMNSAVRAESIHQD